MFRFFRKNIQVIGWVIVITFLFTMFGGALFFGGSKKTTQVNKSTQQRQFVSLGDHQVEYNVYARMLTNAIQYNSQNNPSISPINYETFQLQALNFAIEETIFHIGAVENNVELTKAEINDEYDNFLLNNELKDKKALKALLKENNYPFDVFDSMLKKQLKVQKFKALLTADIDINDSILEKVFSSVDIQVINIMNTPETETKEQYANQIYEQLLDGLEFTEAVLEYSDNEELKQNNGELNAINFGTLPETLETIIYNLEINEISTPININGDFFIVKLLNKQQGTQPEGIEQEALKGYVAQNFTQRRLNEYIATFLINNPIEVYADEIRPVYLKQNGQLEEAINAYQKLASLSAQNPLPHFFIADVYMKLDQIDNALIELEKADIKADLSVEYDFVELHIVYGDLLVSIEDNDKAIAQYDKAYELSTNNISGLSEIKQRFSALNQNEKVLEIEAKIAALEALKIESETELTEEITVSNNDVQSEIN